MSPKAAPSTTRRRLFIAAVSLGILGAAALVIAKPVHKKKAPTKAIMIKGCKKKKKAVKFSHKKHLALKKFGVKCKTCHHDVKGKRAEKPKCSSCHAKKQKKAKGGNVDTCFKKSKKKNPIHKQCIGCHKKMKAKVKKAPPTKCKQCHPKK